MEYNYGKLSKIACSRYKVEREEGVIRFIIDDESYEPPKILGKYYRRIGPLDEFYKEEDNLLLEPENEYENHVLTILKRCYKEVHQRNRDL